MLTIDIAGLALQLLPEGAAYLPAQRMLLVADAHFGKAVSFRRAGLPVPEATTAETLERLTRCIAATQPAHIAFLGDFLHSRHSHAAETQARLLQWRERHAGIELLLVRGNHDDRAGDPPPALAVRCVDEPFALGALALCHHPQRLPGQYVLAGHLHPCVRLGGRARERLRLPCFWMGQGLGVLPAFGSFTGMHAVEPEPGDRLYALAEERVVALPPPA